MYVYVASSWRNPIHAGVCAALKSASIDHYNFKDSEGFHWSEVMPGWKNAGYGETEGLANEDDYLAALKHPRAIEGFESDMAALTNATHVVCVLPCGRSAHLELGWAVGRKQTAILLDGPMVTPELMYLAVGRILKSIPEMLAWMNVDDPCPRPFENAVMAVVQHGDSPADVLQKIRDRWNDPYPLCSVLDVADIFQSHRSN